MQLQLKKQWLFTDLQEMVKDMPGMETWLKTYIDTLELDAIDQQASEAIIISRFLEDREGKYIFMRNTSMIKVYELGSIDLIEISEGKTTVKSFGKREKLEKHVIDTVNDKFKAGAASFEDAFALLQRPEYKEKYYIDILE